MKSKVSTLFVYGILCAVLAVAAVGCSSGSKKTEAETPDWTQQPSRTVDAGYIVYIGKGEDRSPGRARFKAEGMALQDLSNECSFAPKGTRIEDHAEEVIQGVTHSYAKIAIEFQDCEAARNAVTPEQIRTLANPQLASEVKRYQDAIDNPQPDETRPLEYANNNGPSGGGGGGGGVMFIRSSSEFFIVRQQVAYSKQYVILAPAAQYPPMAVQTVTPVRGVVVANSAVRQYEIANPQVRSSSQTFSAVRSQQRFVRQPSTAMRNSQVQRAARPVQQNRRKRRRLER